MEKPVKFSYIPPSKRPMKEQSEKGANALHKSLFLVLFFALTSSSWPAAADSERGVLRIVALRGKDTGATTPQERALVEAFAREQGRRSQWLWVTDRQQQIQAVVSGAAMLAVTMPAGVIAANNRQLLATQPWAQRQLQVIVRANTTRIRRAEDLLTRQPAAQPGTPAWQALRRLAADHPGLSISALTEADTSAALAGLRDGRYDLLLMENLRVEPYLQDFPGLQVAFPLAASEDLVWAVADGEQPLVDMADAFLDRVRLAASHSPTYRADLPQILARKVLRVLTTRSLTNYYQTRGRLRGFEYEFMHRFAEREGLRLEVVLADSLAEMETLLLAGKGDVIAASVPAGGYRQDDALAVTVPYNYSAPVVIARKDGRPIIDARDLDGRRIVLPPESPYRYIAEALQHRGIRVRVAASGPGVDKEATLFQVAQGMFDVTLLGSHEVTPELARHLNLEAHMALAAPSPLVWAVRSSDSLLLAALNDYIAGEFRKGFYNVLYAKYLDNPLPPRGNSHLLTRVEQISPFDDLVIEQAEQFAFDWRLIIAQMYQESHFDPEALSTAGAEGLMQLLPATATEVGINNTNDPVESIRGGLRYLDYLRSRFRETGVQREDRQWFMLAAYNAGFNRIQQARTVAAHMGLDKNRWFDHVERAMLAMAGSQWRNGRLERQCRCGQSVVYVRDIRTRYRNYVRLTGGLRTASRDGFPDQDI